MKFYLDGGGKNMIAKEDELFITEISEEDFRKLNLVAYAKAREDSVDEYGRKVTRLVWKECSMNKVLDTEIDYAKGVGCVEDLERLKTPITIAIHKENGPEPKDYYLDKYMAVLGPATYLVATNIKHLYSTRDYFEDREDYWRVLKRETKAIYRVHLDKKHVENFILKHKRVISKRFPDDTPEHVHVVEDTYDLDEKGEWVLGYRTEIERFSGQGTNCKPYKGQD